MADHEQIPFEHGRTKMHCPMLPDMANNSSHDAEEMFQCNYQMMIHNEYPFILLGSINF
jgi:hypothetical protein